MLDEVLNSLVDWSLWLFSIMVEILAGFINFVSSLLPTWTISFDSLGSAPTTILQGIAWIFPIETLSYCLGLYVACVLLYFSLGILTRWAKVTN